MIPLIVRESAEADVAEAQAWYEKKKVGLGVDFVFAVEQMLDRIRENPLHFEKASRSARRATLDPFPYVIYFLPSDHLIEVVAVVHGHRHHRVWRSRLK